MPLRRPRPRELSAPERDGVPDPIIKGSFGGEPVGTPGWVCRGLVGRALAVSGPCVCRDLVCVGAWRVGPAAPWVRADDLPSVGQRL